MLFCWSFLTLIHNYIYFLHRFCERPMLQLVTNYWRDDPEPETSWAVSICDTLGRFPTTRFQALHQSSFPWSATVIAIINLKQFVRCSNAAEHSARWRVEMLEHSCGSIHVSLSDSWPTFTRSQGFPDFSNILGHCYNTVRGFNGFEYEKYYW